MKNVVCLFSFSQCIVCLFSFSQCIVCLFSFNQCIVCLFSFSQCIVCLFSFNQCIVCLFSSPDPKGQVSYCHHLASVVVVRRKLFQRSSPLKVLYQWKPNLVWIITRVSGFKIYLPCNFEVNPNAHFGVISLFSSNFQILILFVLYFKNYKRQMVSWNCKHVQHVKIYLPCNFEVNPITHFGVIALFSSFFFLAHLATGHVSFCHG